jgi:hypothetical protein
MSFKNFLKRRGKKVAEGVVSASLLPPGDQGRKVGFATRGRWPTVTVEASHRLPRRVRPHSRVAGGPIRRQPEDYPKLGTRANQTLQDVLVDTQGDVRNLPQGRDQNHSTFMISNPALLAGQALQSRGSGFSAELPRRRQPRAVQTAI